MNWSNVWLIFAREVRDQLRDRRTLFMIAVLPLFMYPLLGMSMVQVSQFLSEHPTRVLLVGASELPSEPALIDNAHFAAAWFSAPDKQRLLEVTLAPTVPFDASVEPSSPPRARRTVDEDAAARALVEQGKYDAVVLAPPEFSERLDEYRRGLRARLERQESSAAPLPRVASLQVLVSTAREKSQVAARRLEPVLRRWGDETARRDFTAMELPDLTRRAFEIDEIDVADANVAKAALWSKILPFLLLTWALTGAFYPAVDLCAGEKERGTLETLLCSPAERSEIVWGKLLTVMMFSAATPILNLASLAVTGMMLMNQLPIFAPPPWTTPLWLGLALPPIAALFSALCLALAAFARSSKEGQYYLLPVIMISMPLAMLPMSPSVELNLGTSLIPLSGVVLLLRTMLEGNYAAGLPFVPPVLLVTGGCCLLAIRWAIDQFTSENVLFRESERLDLGMWLWSLLRDREALPSAAEAVMCGVLVLVLRFFMNFSLKPPETFAELAVLTIVIQVAVIATPALLMATMLTSRPRATLLLCWPRWWTIPAAALLALAAHPLATLLFAGVRWLYPISTDAQAQLGKFFIGAPLWQLLLLLGVLPAVCEELAYRGFVLSGLRRSGPWRGIALSAVFFGLAHGIIQQSLLAVVQGLVLGYLAIRTRSILPCIAYHAVHNSLTVGLAHVDAAVLARAPWIEVLLNKPGDEGFVYAWWVVAVGGLATVVLLRAFASLPAASVGDEPPPAEEPPAQSTAQRGALLESALR